MNELSIDTSVSEIQERKRGGGRNKMEKKTKEVRKGEKVRVRVRERGSERE